MAIRKSILPFLFFFVPVLAWCQPEPIVGKWKITVVEAGARYDFRTDSITVPAAIRQGWQGSSDSSLAMGVIKMLAGEMAGGGYVFAADGTYREIKGEKLLRQGTYKIERYNDESMLTLVYANTAKVETKDYLKYSFEGGQLKMTMEEGGEKLTFYLEKMK
ncbi:MAG: hypothetical protein EOO09_06500 [Chitinophagaceae bacterium]|nr:MAG: hypothetical protein EOO09_06500 [Chitinophagaceae bacterium]